MPNKVFVEKEREGEESTTADRRPRSIWNRCYATQRRRGRVAARLDTSTKQSGSIGFGRSGRARRLHKNHVTTLQHTAHNSAEPREGEIKPKLRDSGARLLTFLSSNRMCNQTTELLEQKAQRFRRRDNNDRWDDLLMTK